MSRSAVEWGKKWAVPEIYHLTYLKSNFLGNWNMKNYRIERKPHKLSNFQLTKEFRCKELFEGWLFDILSGSEWFLKAQESLGKLQCR